jgi:hypothetical protein
MYTDYWVKTTDEASWIQQAKTAGVLVESTDMEGNHINVPAPGVNIDVIGTIYTPGEYIYESDGTMNVVKEPVALPGFHINIRSQQELNTSELSIIDQPKNPVRVWF